MITLAVATHRQRHRARSDRGQTTTEFVMILALVTAVAVSTLAIVQPNFRAQLQSIIECLVNDYDDCKSPPQP